jgi:thiol:disulfide interchange protein
VIALKILGFVSQAKESPARVRQLGLVYGAGVLVSFLVLAAFVIGLKAAGHKAGWGIQFSNPLFIVGLTALVTLVALNLFGVF